MGGFIVGQRWSAIALIVGLARFSQGNVVADGVVRDGIGRRLFGTRRHESRLWR